MLIAESNQVAGPIRSVFSYAMQATMRRARALGDSANRITLLRDKDGDGVAEKREIFMSGLNQPFGMALLGDTFYVGNTDGVMAFPYVAGADSITAAGRRLTTFKPSGHWTRSLLPSPDGKKLYAGVGSLTNIADEGMAAEKGRAAVYELDLAGGSHRIFAGGLRNPVGLAWEPQTGMLWTVVNERDGLGDETASRLSDLGSRRRFLRLALLLLGAKRWTIGYRRIRPRSPRRSSPIMRWAGTPPPSACAGCRPARCRAFRTAWQSASTGSWNRSTLSGYKVVFVPFENGRPSGPARDILSGFLAPDERESYDAGRRHLGLRRLSAGGG